MYIEFHTEGSTTSDGFSASYYSIYTGNDLNPCRESESFYITESNRGFGCNGIASNIQDTWLITVESGKNILLELSTIYIPWNAYIEVYDGSSTSDYMLDSCSDDDDCGSYKSSSNQMYIVLDTPVYYTDDDDSFYSGYKFIGSYTSISVLDDLSLCETSNTNYLSSSSGEFGCNEYSNNLDS